MVVVNVGIGRKIGASRSGGWDERFDDGLPVDFIFENVGLVESEDRISVGKS